MSMQYRLNTKKPPLWCLILLISFPSVSTVFISPALPAISDTYNVSNGAVQQLITIFVIGYALGQLIYSPFANRYGRKIAAYIGLALYFISCGICFIGIYGHSLEILYVGRLLMALGSSMGMIISFTLIHDFYFPEQARPIVSYTVLAYAFMPAVAIAVGGYLTTNFSWVSCFYFYLFYGFIILAAVLALPETLQTKQANALKLKKLLSDYISAFGSWRLMFFSSIYGMMSSFIYIIASGAPFIGIDYLHLTSAHYGALLLIAYAGQLCGALIAGSISKRYSAYTVMGAGYSCVIIGTVFMFICFLAHWINIFSLILPLAILMMGMPMVYSTVTVKALSEYSDKATGSAIMSFSTMTITLIASFIFTQLPTHKPITLPISFVVLLVLALIALMYAVIKFSDKNN